MKTRLTILILCSICFQTLKAQTTAELSRLLDHIAGPSKDISKTSAGAKMISLGPKILKPLSDIFTDTTQTKVYSECQSRYLTKADLAIILSDRIEMMPYAQVTGIQNCLFQFCPDNRNLIEYYLFAVRRKGYATFKADYLAWLKSADRLKEMRQRGGRAGRS
ncbi:MAG: hypothetical protein EOP04_10020 [Proteobacteria bacterium]|nr:MAG: hypothetical protein EOP04_10020 [Pseudomonadota bacterium]